MRVVAGRTAARGEYEVAVLTSADPLVETDGGQGYAVHAAVREWSVWRAGVIARQALELAPAAVHLQNPTIKYTRGRSVVMGEVARALKRLAPRVRVVVMQHDIAVGRPLLRWRYWPLFRACDAVCVSNSRDEQAMRGLGVAAEKIYRTPIASHFRVRRTAAGREQARAELGVGPAERLIAYFGFVHPERNVEVLLRALAELRRQGTAARGIIIGGPSAGAEAYYRACQKWAQKLQAPVIWTGYADGAQVERALLAADVFVSLPQRGADLRNSSILAALQAELPVVTAENSRYFVDADLAGLGCRLVAPRDVGAVVRQVRDLLERPPAAAALARVAQQVDPERVWERHIEVNHCAYKGLRLEEEKNFGF